jgi:putative ABC transport system ATP-binding protein
MSSAEPVVSCRELQRTYEGLVPVEALRPASFSVGRGEQVVVCGPSGSGKSTLLNLLGLLDRPNGGSYRLLGEDTAGLGERDRAGLRAEVLGFVFQSFHLMSGRTATENVATGLLYRGTRRRIRMQRAREVLERVGLADRADAEVTRLSGGERQRVAVARAIVHEPELLLADEPTGNLDTATSRLLLDLLDQLNADGYTQIIVTHNEAIAARAARRIDVVDGNLTDSAS